MTSFGTVYKQAPCIKDNTIEVIERSKVRSNIWRQRSFSSILIPKALNESIKAAKFPRVIGTPLGTPVDPEVKAI